ncbi:MAG: EAL domain-containing protein [Chloroflexota bacterium]
MDLFSRDRWHQYVERLTGDRAAGAADLIDQVLQERRYWPVFQPIRDLDSNRIVGYEAFSRFDAPLTTQRLFDHAGVVGRGMDLEVATMTAAVKAAVELPSDCWVSVNSSAALLSETDTIGAILERLDRPVVLELSEYEIITDPEPIVSAMERLGDGRMLAVDDAGAGLASLRNILEVRPAYVKMDLGLVQGVATDLSRRALLAGMVHFAREADVALVGMGIQNEDDLETLKDLGVALGQGYLLGRPERGAFLEDEGATVPARTPRRRAPARTQPS